MMLNIVVRFGSRRIILKLCVHDGRPTPSSRAGMAVLQACVYLLHASAEHADRPIRMAWRLALRQRLRCLLGIRQVGSDEQAIDVHYVDRIDSQSCSLATQSQHNMAKLETALAYVSTLGGGYYLTYHYKRAVQAAVLQMALAVHMDDGSTVIRTWTHLAYVGSSCGCNKVAYWAASIAVRLCAMLGENESASSYRAARVCRRYVVKLAQARRRQAVSLSDREIVHAGTQRLTDEILLRHIQMTFAHILPLSSVMRICADAADACCRPVTQARGMSRLMVLDMQL